MQILLILLLCLLPGVARAQVCTGTGSPPSVLLGFPGGAGDAGDREVVDFRFATTDIGSFGCDPFQAVRVTFDAGWDRALIELEDITMAAGAFADWTPTFTDLPGGGTRIEFSGPSTTITHVGTHTTTWYPVATLGFRYTANPGMTEILMLNGEVEEADGSTDIWVYHIYTEVAWGPTYFINGTVATTPTSFGMLKARY